MDQPGSMQRAATRQIPRGIVRARIAGLLFVLIWLSGAWFGSWELNPNNATRMFAAISLVESGDATIDEFAPLTIDKASFGGHVYLDKAPGMTLMAVPVVAVLDRVNGVTAEAQWRLFHDSAASMFLMPRVRVAAALTSALLTAIAAVMLFGLTVDLTGSLGAGIFAAIGYGLGTPIWGWSTTIFGHAAAAALLLIATILIWRGSARDRPDIADAAFAGLALGWAVVVEYQAALTGAAIACFALWRLWQYPAAMRVRPIVAATLGAIVALIPLVVYNLIAFGTIFKLGYEGVVGFAGMHEGLFGLTYPKWSVFWKIIGGLRRGMIWVAPILLLAPIGLALLIRRRDTRTLGVLAAAAALIVFLINASYVYWDGGSSTGPRLAVPAIGFLALGLGPVWMACRHLALRLGAALLLALSVLINLAIAAAAIDSPASFSFPLWQWVLRDRFWQGQLRDFPADYWHWSPWAGFALYVAIAVPFGIAIVYMARPTRRVR